jgi:hypothetical protein
MSDAILPLRRAIHAHLAADAALLAMIGPGRIHEEPPRALTGLHVVYGEVAAGDWSTSSDRGCEQQLEIMVWAGESASSRQALEVAARIAASLDGARLAPAGHRLVDLAWRSTSLARDPKTHLPTVTLRFRAVTEAL